MPAARQWILRSPIPATGRSRWARIIISSRPTRRCASTATRRGASASTSPPVPRCASSRARRARCASSLTTGHASCTASTTRLPARSEAEPMATRISRAAYADMFGPTVGDRVRLADTELFIEVEQDRTVYGEEVKFGGGKVIRDGMGQSQHSRAEGAVDTVITNALILDHWGIVKADIGLKDGRVAAIGKAGNPDVQPGVDIIIGPDRKSTRLNSSHT